MKSLNNKIMDILGKNDISVVSIEKQGEEHVSELEWYSPAGEDVIIVVWFNGTNNGFISSFYKYADDFDADEHAKGWVEYRGQGGCPSSIRELIDDADAIKSHLMEAAASLESLSA